MNSKECLDWLTAVSDCFPKLKLGALQTAVKRLSESASSALWEGGVLGRAGFSPLAVRFWGGPDFVGWTKRAAAEFGAPDLELPRESAEGFPWLSVVWNAEAGRWESLQFLGAALQGGARGPKFLRAKRARPVEFRQEPFRPGGLGNPALEKALRDFSALHKVSGTTHAKGSVWSLRLERGAPFPDFLRCDLAAAYTAHSSQLALLLLDRRVTELSFEGESLWAYFR